MKNTPPQEVRLEDYRPLPFVVKEVELSFDLDEEATRVVARTHIERISSLGNEPLKLYGEDLKLLEVSINDTPLRRDQYEINDPFLTIHNLPETFIVEIATEINPAANTKLMGLYKSGGVYCTQNEPEGFRRITYFLDRPDVMATYTTKICADKKRCPILLSNGNRVESGDLPGGKHWVKWHDPFRKPCYLYALVAGDLGMISDTFTTKSGRVITLEIYCDRGNEGKCSFAMEALKKSMKWDEEVYGLEYDLDIFMIVAVDSFNFGAMENKGLNIFNTSCVLADAATATDDNFTRVEGVVAHEYFHNWTGNRVTCRDWFQLTLKEGLTVFRDQEFSSDMNSRPVKRIEDVSALRTYQFPEDSGPTSHPIKPNAYLEINNFYTTTIYNKGAEVIRMIETIIGKEQFRRGIDKYFELYDGEAVTTEDFLHAMEEASRVDLSAFSRWYHQSGTLELWISSSYDAESKRFTINVVQKNPPTADQKEKLPLTLPLAIGLIDKEGKELDISLEGCRKNENGLILQIDKEKHTFHFDNIAAPPLPSLNRSFSAPVVVHYDYSDEELMFLMANDSDSFNRWDAAQELGINLLLREVQKSDNGEIEVDEGYLRAFGKVLADKKLDPALKAMCLELPTEDTLGQRVAIIDFDAIHRTREAYLAKIAATYEEEMKDLYHSLKQEGPYRLDPLSKGQRQLKAVALRYIAETKRKEAFSLCLQQFEEAANMTDQYNAMRILSDFDTEERDRALDLFYKKWSREPLVMCKWLTVQALSKAEGALERVKNLLNDPVYDEKVPNAVRALLGSFMLNHVQYNAPSGAGYAFIAEQIAHLDSINPHLSARLATGFRKIGKLDSERKALLHKRLEQLMSGEKLSTQLYEIVSKCIKEK